MKWKKSLCFLVLILTIVSFYSVLSASTAITPQDILKLKYVSSARMSPDGQWIAYTVSVPRNADDQPGSAYSELYLISSKGGEIKPFITGEVRVTSVAWKPDGTAISFLMRRGEKSKTQVWMIPVDGGEARAITNSETDVRYYSWHPKKDRIGYVAKTPQTAREKALKKKGYDFIYYEEDWKHYNLYLIDVNEAKIPKPNQITEDVTVINFHFSPDGSSIAAAITPKNLIDHYYMFKKIYLINPETKQLRQLTDNPGKLGNFAFSPDGRYLAYTGASRRADHSAGNIYIIPTAGGKSTNLTPPNFRGTFEWVDWKDNKHLLCIAGEGVWPTISTVNIENGQRQIVLHSKETGVVFRRLSFDSARRRFAFVGQSAFIPSDLFLLEKGDKIHRLTYVNNWLKDRDLGKQAVIHYPARDGMEIEGILIYPVDYQEGKTYPLVVTVHGGPESHYSNGWLSGYSRPGQVLAGRGYFVFYPNYRSSTGYGYDYGMKWHLTNPAGTEFDDVADGIDYLVKKGLVDRERVGLGGGSYGGFAAAWFGTYYTKYVKAVCMFVGISDLISKRSTTDIPYEELYVHSGKKLEDMWQLSLERSPIYYAHQSKTAVLIYGGTDDPRVHPSQSLELYRRLKMNNHPAVRLVQYPGEQHGNRKQPGRIDVLYRTLMWYDWYVKDAKPLEGPMPPLDISNKYGIDLPDKK